MYYLMNKDNIIAEFDASSKSEFSDNVSFSIQKVIGKLPIGFENINTWIDGRKASKHNAHLKSLMRSMNCDDSEGFIRVTHAASINDTFWIKSKNENISWNSVSLYRNQFSETISQLAFEGVGLYDEVFSSTSPEFTCDGSFSKCFRKEKFMGEYGSDIFLYKRGHEFSIGNVIKSGYEPYCEQMASEIAKVISPEGTISYELVTLHNRLASRCNLFTNEDFGYASYAKVTSAHNIDLQQTFEYFSSIGSEQMFREMLVIDSLCFNQDRHAGNYGVLFDNNTLEIIGMSPIFDFNLSLLPYAEMNTFHHIGDKLFECSPKLGEDFTRIGQMGLNDILRSRVKDMLDFSFSFCGDDVFTEERVKQLEKIVHSQAAAILSSEKLYTRDVFPSAKADEIQKLTEKVSKASDLMKGFIDTVDESEFGNDVFSSECNSSDTVQYYVEKSNYMMTIDFLKGDIVFTDNTQPISFGQLKKIDNDFYKTAKNIQQQLRKHLKANGNKTFMKYFHSLDNDMGK